MDMHDEDRGSDAAQGRNESPIMEATTTGTFSSPPVGQRAGNQGVNYSGGSDRKRSRRAMADDGALDDILGQITSKLTTLSTRENLTEEDSINAFIDVLNCQRSEAQFFLESSNWNVETAAMLWLENNPVNSYSSAYQPTYAYAGNTYAEAPYYNGKLPAGGEGSAFQKPRSQPRYRPRTVVIEGLPKEWTARVSKNTGQVYFMHIATGITQYCVPTGYADLPGSGSPENAIDLSVSDKGNGALEDDMLDVSKDSDMEGGDEEIEPLSPVSDPLGINMMQNSIAQAQYSTQTLRPASHKQYNYRAPHNAPKSRSKAKSNDSSVFRDAMDELNDDEDAQSEHSANSAKAVWDEGSGYSLNDGPAYSVSSTTTNSSADDNSSVFGSMGRNSYSHNANSTNTTNNHHNANGISTNNPIHSALPYYAQGPVSQELTLTPTEGQYISAHSSGIAMLTPSEVNSSGNCSTAGSGNGNDNADNSDYFFGSFTPGRESNGSSTTTLTK